MARNVRDRFQSSLYSILCLLLSISLGSCYPEFKNPIPPPPELKADRQILGTWVGAEYSGSKEQLSIFERSSGWIDVVYINDIDSKESQKGINVIVFEGYSTSVNEQKFLCLRFRERDFDDSHEEVGKFLFYILNYETPSNDELIIKHFSLQKVKELIKEGKLKGDVVKRRGRYFDEITVTSSSDELIEAISKEGVEAFIEQDEDDILVFSRGTIGTDSSVGEDEAKDEQ
ncbi:MAG: hypothetical protein GQ528_07345 [Woeseiaceae bacterium]|nr:hypothetical protein [Woeseiaceae bacterium]